MKLRKRERKNGKMKRWTNGTGTMEKEDEAEKQRNRFWLIFLGLKVSNKGQRDQRQIHLS